VRQPTAPALMEFFLERCRKPVAGKSGAKKPFAALRHKWLRMDEDGDTAEVALGKHALMHRLGVQASSRPALYLTCASCSACDVRVAS